MVDWFLPIGQMISSLPGYPGLRITSSSTTRYGRADVCSRFYWYDRWYYDRVPDSSFDPWFLMYQKDDTTPGMYIRRKLGVSAPSFSVNARGLTTGRAYNAVAMLTQFLRNKGP